MLFSHDDKCDIKNLICYQNQCNSDKNGVHNSNLDLLLYRRANWMDVSESKMQHIQLEMMQRHQKY